MIAVATNKMIETSLNPTKPKFKQKLPTSEESKLIRDCSSDLVKEINKNSFKKPHELTMNICKQLIDCLVENEQCGQEQCEQEVIKKYLLINAIKRISFKLNEKYNHNFAAKKTREKIKLLLIEKFSCDLELANFYNDKFEEILRTKNML